jgi:hypothetical protein
VSTTGSGVTYREQLRVPVGWWVPPWFFVIVLTAGSGRYLGVVAFIVTLVASVMITVVGLLRYGAVEVLVDDVGLHTQGQVLPHAAIGAAAPLDREQARALCGPRADARAPLLIRGYVPTGVRVDVTDPRDPAPYWFVSSRHPHELAAALNSVRQG